MKVDNKFEFDKDPFHQYLGLTLEEAKENYARVRLKIGANTATGINDSVHGGILATMIDMAAVPAVFANMRKDDVPGGTADLQITYLRQAHGQWLEAEANIVKKGKQLATIHVNIKDSEGLLCATGRVLYAFKK